MKHHALANTLLPVAALVAAILVAPRPAQSAPAVRHGRATPPDAPLAPAPVPAAGLTTLDGSPAAAELDRLGLAEPVPVPADPAREPEPSPRAPQAKAAALTPLGDARLDPALGRFVAPLGGGRAVLTLDPRLQERLERILAGHRVPWGATVMLEAGSGRVLALAEHSQAEPGRKGLALSALAPAASVFKLVTAAALLERGVGVQDPVCYHGGRRRLQPKLLADDPRRDRRCVSLAEAFGHSTNVVFAKLAGRDLDAASLRAVAERFLFNTPIAFPRAVETSPARIPDDAFGLANTAAGFGDVKLSPLHGALLASVVANGGLLVPPVLVDDVLDGPPPAPAAPWRVVDEAVASELGEMMRGTVTVGTARRTFRRAGAPLRGVSVAGKTGSLSDPQPFKDYTWFVGYAPAEKPEVVVATVIVNGRLWQVRAPTVAKEALEAFFATHVASPSNLPPGTLRTASVR